MTQLTSNTFKMLYVIAILMIVDGHIGHFDYLDFHNLLRYQNYHIALFVFTSGYFLNLQRSYGDFFKHKLSRLIIPLYLWNIFYGAVCWLLNNFMDFNIGAEFTLYNLLYAPLVDGHQFIYNMASWFLVPLFFIQTITFLLLKPFVDKQKAPHFTIIFIFFVLALIAGSIALTFGPKNHAERNLTLLVLRTFYFLPAYALGILYRHKLEKYDTLNSPLYFFTLLSIITILCTAYPGYNHIPSWLDEINAPIIVIYTISFCAILFWLRISKILSPLIEKSKTLNYIANHTFDIMLHQFIGFMLVKAMFSGFSDFNHPAFKKNIWYYYFPFNEELISWFYIFITIVIALLTGFTTRKICSKLNTIFIKKRDIDDEKQ